MNEQVMIELLRREFSEVYHERSTTEEAIARITAAFAPSQPVSAQPAVEVPEVVGYLCNGGTKLMHASDRKEAVWNAGRPLMEVEQHARIVAALQARAVVMPERMKTQPFTTIDRGSKDYKAGWNGRLNEFARLNGKDGV